MLAHRLVLTAEAELNLRDTAGIVAEVLAAVAVPGERLAVRPTRRGVAVLARRRCCWSPGWCWASRCSTALGASRAAAVLVALVPTGRAAAARRWSARCTPTVCERGARRWRGCVVVRNGRRSARPGSSLATDAAATGGRGDRAIATRWLRLCCPAASGPALRAADPRRGRIAVGPLASSAPTCSAWPGPAAQAAPAALWVLPAAAPGPARGRRAAPPPPRGARRTARCAVRSTCSRCASTCPATRCATCTGRPPPGPAG